MNQPQPSVQPSVPPPTQTALQETRLWLEKAVIGLKLCPFAKAVHQKGQIRWVLSASTSPKALLAELKRELSFLAQADALQVDTTVLVHPQLLQRFEDFNDFLVLADQALAQLDLEGVLQIASFHPQYQFEGTEPDDMGNFSNRSPHPTLHLLREASVSRAVAAFPEAEDIFERNIATLHNLGAEGWKQLFGD